MSVEKKGKTGPKGLTLSEFCFSIFPQILQAEIVLTWSLPFLTIPYHSFTQFSSSTLVIAYQGGEVAMLLVKEKESFFFLIESLHHISRT